MIFEKDNFQIEIVDELNYNHDLTTNSFKYEEQFLVDSNFVLPSKFGVKLLKNGVNVGSALIGAEGGATGVHEFSQVIEHNRILICCSDSVFCLDLPSLNLNWVTKVDEITAFGIVKIKEGYIIHGELEITRINTDGVVVWQNGGADIFVLPDGDENFHLEDNYIKVLDWSGKIYKWDLEGKSLSE